MANEKKSTALATVPAKDYAIATYDAAAIREVIEINFGTEKSLTEFDLTSAKVPSGAMTVFNVTGPDGDQNPAELFGIVVAQHSRRKFWYKGKDEAGASNGPPDCVSHDGINGVGEPAKLCGGQCAACPHSKFGSGIKDGKPTKGQRCAQNKALFIMTPDSILPLFLSLPPTSLGAWKSYLAGLIGKRLPVSGVVTRFYLTKEKNAGGTVYAEARFELVDKLDAETAAKMQGIGKVFGEMFKGGEPAPAAPVERIDTRTGEVTVEGKAVPPKNVFDTSAKDLGKESDE